MAWNSLVPNTTIGKKMATRDAFLPEPHNVLALHSAWNDVKGRILIVLDFQYAGSGGYDIKLLIISSIEKPKLKITWQPWSLIHQYITEGKMQPFPL